MAVIENLTIMPVLENRRYELLAQNLARGCELALAARKAGYLTQEKAEKDAKLKQVRDRVRELLGAAAETVEQELALSLTTILARLEKLQQSDIREAISFDSSGVYTLRPITEWTNEIAARVTEIKFDAMGFPRAKVVSNFEILKLQADILKNGINDPNKGVDKAELLKRLVDGFLPD